jgi:mono/diheme cytochrome c family protein
MTERQSAAHVNRWCTRLPIIIATLGLAACGATLGEGPDTPDNQSPTSQVSSNTSTGGNPSGSSGVDAGAGVSAADAGSSTGSPNGSSSGPLVQTPIPTPCSQAPKKAQAALTTYCGSCHGSASAGMGGFKVVDDATALVTSGKVIAGKPDDSPIYKRMSTGTMPPASVAKRPGDPDIQAVKDWISCGAEDWNATSSAAPAFDFLTVDDRLSTMLRDVRSIANPTDRLRIRYFDLSMLANAGYSEAQLQVYREAVSFLANSLSTGRNVVAPRAIDKDKLIFRIDLRDYGWSAATWTAFEQIYPYAVIYDQNSRLFPFDEVSAEQLRDETGTQIPFIQGDWFISHGSRPPLYFDVLGIPGTLQELETQLGVNIDRDIADEQVLRSGFKNAGPSQNNRVIERHDLGGNRGALWVSYDFTDNLGDHDIFSHPLDFQENGGELIFNLDNGLQGYFVTNAAGVRQDKAPNNIVQDPAARDGAVETGISCMNCHQEDGQLPKFDEIRDFTLSTGASAAEIESVLGLYATQADLKDAFDRDQNLYRTARAALGISKVGATTMHTLDDTHLGLIDINGVAAAVGVTTEQLERALDASPQAFPPEVVTLRTTGGAVQRDSFESVLPDLITALGLGKQLVVSSRVGSSRATSTSATSTSTTSTSTGTSTRTGTTRTTTTTR